MKEVSELSFQLKKLSNDYSHLFVYHQWPFEHARWTELMFALLSRVGSRSEQDVREAIERLDDLDLLGVEGLAGIPEQLDEIDYGSPLAARITQSLSESGFEDREARVAVAVMHEAAKVMTARYQGKVQRFLRRYGERMIDDLCQEFRFSGLSERDTRHAFTYWLQNVANMPVNLGVKFVDEFCVGFNASEDQLVAEADELGINVALLDDMVAQHMQDKQKKALGDGEKAR